MLEIRHLSVRRASSTVLSDLSLTLPRGSMTALVGKNGCGKSTLLSAIGGTCPYAGEIRLDGTPTKELPPRELAKKMSRLPQLLSSPHMTVAELVLLGRHPHVGALSRPTEKDQAACAHAIAEVGIAHLADCYLDELSGGERQRAYLAMTVAQDAPLWLLDEPTTYMDPSVSRQLMSLLCRLRREREKTVLVAMHDLSSAVRYADRIALIDEGTLSFCGSVEECLEAHVLEDVFSVRRLESDGEIFFV